MEGTPRARRWLSWLASAVALLIGLPALVWIGWPWWFPALAGQLAARAGMEIVQVDVGRPGLDGVPVEYLALNRGGLHIELAGAHLVWTLNHLLDGRLRRVTADSLVIVQLPEATPADPAASPFDSAIIPALPVDEIDVRRLVFDSPGLPLRMEGSLRLLAKEILLRLKATQSPADMPVRLTLRLRENGEFLALLHSSDDKDIHALEARGAVKDGILSIAGSLNLGDYELSLLTGLLGLTGMNGTIEGPFAADFTTDWGLNHLEIQPDIALRAETDRGRIRRFSLAGSVTWDALDEGGELRVELADTSVSKATSLELRAAIRSVDVSVDATWALSHSDLSSLAALGGFPEIGGSGEGRVTVEAPLPFDLGGALISSTAKLEITHAGSTEIRLSLLNLAHKPDEPWVAGIEGLSYRSVEDGVTLTFIAPKAHVDLPSNDPLSFNLTTAGDATYADGDWNFRFKGLSITGQGQAVGSGWSGRVDVGYRGRKFPVTVEADADLDGMAWHSAIDFPLNEPLLATTLGDKRAYDITGGRFTGSLEGRLQGEALTTQVRGSFTEGKLVWDDYQATGVSAGVTCALAADESWSAVLDDVVINLFDPGVAISDIRTSLRLDDKTAHIAAASARLLGGEITTTSFDYDLERGTGAFQVTLSDIDLGALLALEGEDVDGTGSLEGTLPVGLSAAGVTVTKGNVHTVGPGLIRISPRLTHVIEQPGLDFALRALEDFSYSSLEADVDYSAGGDLLAAVRLKGRNPLIEKGRPIHYNLNISETIPNLLASLRVQDDVNERVERRVREGVRK